MHVVVCSVNQNLNTSSGAMVVCCNICLFLDLPLALPQIIDSNVVDSTRLPAILTWVTQFNLHVIYTSLGKILPFSEVQAPWVCKLLVRDSIVALSIQKLGRSSGSSTPSPALQMAAQVVHGSEAIPRYNKASHLTKTPSNLRFAAQPV